MKRSVIIVLLAFAGFVNSQAQSMLKVRLADNRPINVSVDGRYFNKTGTSVTVGELPRGRHRLKIFIVERGRRGRGHEDVIFDGKVKTYDGMITLFSYDGTSREIQVEDQDIATYTNNHPPDRQGERLEGSTRYGIHNPPQNYEADGPGRRSYDDNAQPASPAPTGTLEESNIEKLKAKIAGKKTDTEKMNLLKEGLKDETFTTFQVGTMMEWLSFESRKVEFAEWAYTKTVDKELFSDLENNLTYKNYREDLENFLKVQK